MHNLPSQLRELLTADGDPDESLQRLFPPAYADDPERAAEYNRLMRDELLNRRLEALDVVENTAGAEVLTEEQASAWLRVLNDLRLVLGTRLGITEDEGPGEVTDPSDPRAPLVALYWFLSYLLEAAVDALSGSL